MVLIGGNKEASYRSPGGEVLGKAKKFEAARMIYYNIK
jgi:hypothetical protein